MCFGKKHVLVADIGGTNTNFAVLNPEYKVIFKKDYKSQDINDFSSVVNEVIRESKVKIENACFAAAGPIEKNRTYCKLTNLTWAIDKNEMMKRTKLKKIILINDFEAIGYGIPLLKKDLKQIETLKETDYYYDYERIAVIGAGTGLGMNVMMYDKKTRKFTAVASEGGHADFPAIDDIDYDLYKYIAKTKKYCDIESVVSGHGTLNIYNFLVSKKIKQNAKIKKEINSAKDSEKPALITKYGLSNECPLCVKVLDLFVKYYAAAARNLALKVLPSKVCIAGGIAPKIIEKLKQNFMNEFVKNNQMNYVLKNINVYVVMDYFVSVLGAANIAFNYMNDL